MPSEREYVTRKCLIGLYIPLLLNTGFGFANDSQNIYVVDKIAGEKPGMSLVHACLKVEGLDIYIPPLTGKP